MISLKRAWRRDKVKTKYGEGLPGEHTGSEFLIQLPNA